MIKNRSVPTNCILPHVYYDNLAEAVTWLIKVFGFIEYYRIELSHGQLHGVMMYHGDAWVMLKDSGRNRTSQSKLVNATHSLMVFVDDVDEHYRHVKTLGAQIVQELFDTEYGERLYSAKDPEGHLWEFSKHIRDVSPDSFGAR
ncbi:VOC family protein [Paenibacillus sp. MAH-36]|uniref:VOC family protein n=1 Tax=Paenibacillus violae TaxID=3077234 RepID=A0ABU3RQC7_9BACL|nr:VOC family protein [Paenibacillus sp. PFR10]MDU0206503.1 VOC family protein [Paenibacillus sp. PFR10]